MRSNVIVLALAAAAACASTPALAAESGFYLGGGVGSATTDGDKPSGGSISESDTAWKVYGGYRMTIIPLLDFAAELTWRDFGSPEKHGVKFEGDGFDGSVLGILPLGPIDLFARLGLGSYDVKRSGGGAPSHSETSSTALYGVGAGFRISKFNIRAEWERVEPDNVNSIDMYTINVYWQF
jgi:hypothetical protein